MGRLSLELTPSEPLSVVPHLKLLLKSGSVLEVSSLELDLDFVFDLGLRIGPLTRLLNLERSGKRIRNSELELDAVVARLNSIAILLHVQQLGLEVETFMLHLMAL